MARTACVWVALSLILADEAPIWAVSPNSALPTANDASQQKQAFIAAIPRFQCNGPVDLPAFLRRSYVYLE